MIIDLPRRMQESLKQRDGVRESCAIKFFKVIIIIIKKKSKNQLYNSVRRMQDDGIMKPILIYHNKESKLVIQETAP